VSDPVECPCQICVQHPASLRVPAAHDVEDGLDRVMAATARPKPIGPRFEPRLPLGLQRIHDPCLMAAVENHGNPQRSLLLGARLRDVHPSDRLGGERLGRMLHSVDKLSLALSGEHHLAVDTSRQTTGVALGHAPHAHERVGVRSEHQLLQPADPWEVPRLARREDPLTQPPYVPLDCAPVDLAPVEKLAFWSIHRD
jgi:hypothetical protein